MHSIHAFLRQALWLSACIVPIPAGAFAMQTANMLLVSLLLFTALGTLVPFLYFGAQRTGYGAAYGKLRCAAHLECALSVFAVMWFSVWAEAANGSSLETGLGTAGSAAAGAAARRWPLWHAPRPTHTAPTGWTPCSICCSRCTSRKFLPCSSGQWSRNTAPPLP